MEVLEINNKITYHKEGDFFIPDLCLPKQPDGHIGKYGRLRLNYLKNFYIPFYTELLISGTLKQHLLDIDNDASNKVNLLIKNFAKAENVNGLNFDKFCERILRNVSKDNMQFVQSQFDKLYDDFMRYLDYWNEKYYRNGFVDGVQLISRNLNN